MKRKQWLGMGLLSAILTASPAFAQFGAPAAPAAGAGAGAGAAAAPGAAAPAAAAPAAGGFFAKCCAAIEECKRKLCKTPAGQMLNAMTAPAAMMSGGVIPSFCPQMPSAKDLAEPGVTGAEAIAKKDALEAKARREAVRYLGTLDCRYYPEAEASLIAALRTDRVECVRLEAAISFANGCCCTKKVMAALEICVSGSTKDGNPSERSERVRDFAYIALARCVACFQDVQEVEVEKIEKEKPPTERKEGGVTMNLTKADRELIIQSRKTVAEYEAKRQASSSMPVQQTSLPKGQRSLFQIIRYGTEGSAPVQQPVMQPVSRPITSGPIMGPAPRELPQVKVSPTPEPMPVQQTKVLTLTVEPKSELILPTTTESVPVTQKTEMPEVQPMTLTLIEEKPAAAEQPAAPADGIAAPAEMAAPMPSPLTLTVTPSNPATIDQPKAPIDHIATLIDELMTGSTPNERHHAVRALANQDWRKSPQIVAGLVKAARLDSDRAVRVNAIRHLAVMKMDLPYVLEHLKYMQKDQDEWVAQESAIALQKLAN